MQYIVKEKKHDKKHNNFVISRQKVCPEGWRVAFNLSTQRFKDALKYVSEGYYKKKHKNKGRRRPATKATNALRWMRHTFERIGK